MNCRRKSHVFRSVIGTYLSLSMAFGGTTVSAQDWSRFRGPNGSGISHETGIPITWSDDDWLWKVELPGVGHGSPVIWGDRLFLNCASDQGDVRIVQCRSTSSGELLWALEFPAPKHKTHKFNSFATSTPCVDDQHVYVAWGTPEELTLVALTHEGNLAWRAEDLGTVKGGHGFGTSPIVLGEVVIIANDTQAESSLIAVQRMSGEIVWRTPRPGGRLNFSTPCVYRTANGREMLVFVAWPIGVSAVDAASGRLLWETECFDVTKGQRAVASPIVSGELILATSAFVNNPKHLVALRPGESGTVEEIFRVDNSTVPHIPSLLAYDGRLYALADKGIMTCYDLATGRKVWQERLGGNFFSSPICVKGTIYCLSADGICTVIATGDVYQKLGEVDLGEATRATPAVSQGRMIIRTFSHLMAVGTPH